MTLHVLVVGDPGEGFMTRVFDAVDAAGPDRRKLRVTSPDDLVAKLTSLVERERRRVDVLDIFDHGNPGVQFLGAPTGTTRPVLFASDHVFANPLKGLDAARLRPLLARHALVRLLGCEIGGTDNPSIAVSAGQAGRALVLKLAHALGEQREVLATLVPVGERMFDAAGFRDGPGRELLYSSHAAFDGDPPADRDANLTALGAAGFPP